MANNSGLGTGASCTEYIVVGIDHIHVLVCVSSPSGLRCQEKNPFAVEIPCRSPQMQGAHKDKSELKPPRTPFSVNDPFSRYLMSHGSTIPASIAPPEINATLRLNLLPGPLPARLAAEVGDEGSANDVGLEVALGSDSISVPSRFGVSVVVGAVVSVRTPHSTAEPEKVLVHVVSVGPVKGPSWKSAPSDE